MTHQTNSSSLFFNWVPTPTRTSGQDIGPDIHLMQLGVQKHQLQHVPLGSLEHPRLAPKDSRDVGRWWEFCFGKKTHPKVVLPTDPLWQLNQSWDSSSLSVSKHYFTVKQRFCNQCQAKNKTLVSSLILHTTWALGPSTTLKLPKEHWLHLQSPG